MKELAEVRVRGSPVLCSLKLITDRIFGEACGQVAQETVLISTSLRKYFALTEELHRYVIKIKDLHQQIRILSSNMTAMRSETFLILK